MRARYLVRVDDACPTSDWRKWDAFERCFERHAIKPIVAVIPDNRDSGLSFGAPNPDFWDRVRRWQAAGWAIGLHGHTHVFSTNNSGIVPLNPRSEFAGLPLDVQREKIETALAIFAREGVRADAWIAPAHSFDQATLDALTMLGLTVVSDGFFTRPTVDDAGIVWIPQQLWEFKERQHGLWTVCFHPSNSSEGELERLDRALGQYRHAVTTLSNVLAEPLANQTTMDRWSARARLFHWRARLRLGSIYAEVRQRLG